MKVNDKCPYDPSHNNTGTIDDRSGRLFATCGICGKSARVVIYAKQNGQKSAELRVVGRRITGNAKSVYSIRLSDEDKKNLRDGLRVLTFSNNRLQLLYKT